MDPLYVLFNEAFCETDGFDVSNVYEFYRWDVYINNLNDQNVESHYHNIVFLYFFCCLRYLNSIILGK